jgi:hypothetical protein
MNAVMVGAALALCMLSTAAQAQVDAAALGTTLAAVPVSIGAVTKRCARYDVERPALGRPIGRPATLVFEKINGFCDDPSVNAARAELKATAARRGWATRFTGRGGAVSPRDLARSTRSCGTT